MQTILAIDDELSIRESYRMILGDDYRVHVAEDGEAALEVLSEKHVDLILLDLTMPRMSGMDFLERLEERGETVPVIIVTGSNTVDIAVRAIKKGAREFVIKPFDLDDLLALVERTLEELREKRELSTLREQGTAGFDNIIGNAPALMEALAKARQAMDVDSTVLITGETGTGKDVLARAIHFGGGRKDKPFVPLSCCAIPANLVESELFGLTRGAFTGATESRIGKMQVADGGSLFLDEIGEMPVEAQSKLLRVLQEGTFYAVGGNREIEVDVRFICATNRPFDRAIAEGLFRQDLYYRINVLPITMPPLRKRREDIPQLVAHFVAKHGPRVNSRVQDFEPRALSRLAACQWPGNIRELENTVERILVCHSSERVIRAEFLNGIVAAEGGVEVSGLEDFAGLPLQEATQRLERHLIKKALEQCNYVQSQAADALGTTRRILKYKMDQLGITDDHDKHSIAS
ncbi:MAG: sigma-54-dependent Fis family transcriptional regulator [Candidatus Hydrogenedentes bacterium]|nr:sigma-54-dependent Fis family transcriptional regulator [Candidatus Hydrogenedentota bacterium]